MNFEQSRDLSDTIDFAKLDVVRIGNLNCWSRRSSFPVSLVTHV